MPPDRERELDRLRREAAGCRRCDLWRRATQTVFGDGPSRARLMLVGEQPGDQEDKAGEPFVGPAGTLLREALEEAGLGREEILACRAWLDEEIALIKPAAIVALGATAASVVIGSKAKVLRDRGRLFESRSRRS